MQCALFLTACDCAPAVDEEGVGDSPRPQCNLHHVPDNGGEVLGSRSVFLNLWCIMGMLFSCFLCVFLTSCTLPQSVHGGRPVVERSRVLCWDGTVGRTQTPRPEKHTYTRSAIFLQGNTHTVQCLLSAPLGMC